MPSTPPAMPSTQPPPTDAQGAVGKKRERDPLSELHQSSHQARPAPASRCDDCGDVMGWKHRHICRFFGAFECRDFHHRWTSAYVWRDNGNFEQQDCRRCNTPNLPTEHRPRDRSGQLCNKTAGAHDQSRCHMCQRLGRRCDAR